MAVKKSELYNSIWKSCDALRGGMDASEYKDYVLALLFVKYVSDKYAGQPYGSITVPEGGSFADMQQAKGKADIGERLNKIITTLAEANNLQGTIDKADFDDKSKLGDGKEMQDRLTKLIAIFEKPELDFSNNRAADDDLLGDAYEYLMRNFATQSGKSKGQFYTPSEVSQVMAKIIGIENATSSQQTIYDPTCGSGSLLLKAADEAPVAVTIYGQENDSATRALAKMNMVLHDNATAKLEQGNTLSNPLFREAGRLQTFDFVVANPPFSSKEWSNGLKPEQDEFDRFIDGVPPEKNGDYAFFQHLLRSLKSKGKGAIILPHGVLFRGNVEARIRRNIIERGYIKGIIGLPANLFYGTGIPACIIVVDKENADARRGIFMIDASKGFMKDGNKNRLRHQDIHKIVDVFKKQIPVSRYSRMVSFDEIQSNDYNLNIPRYIDTTEPEDIQDIEAHLLGGIPERDIQALGAYWDVLPSVAEQLFQPNERAGYLDLKVDAGAIKQTIFQHPEFNHYNENVRAVYDEWVRRNQHALANIQQGANPKALIADLAEDLLTCFADVPLIDKYDIYQHLMTYWTDAMQDDVYVISADGWLVAKTLRILIKDDSQYHTYDFEVGKTRYKSDIIPPELVIRRYLSVEQQAIDELKAQLEATAEAITALDEELEAEDSLIGEFKNDSGKVVKAQLKKRVKELETNEHEREIFLALSDYLELMDRETNLKAELKTAQVELYQALLLQYQALTEDEIKTLVIRDKWLAQIEMGITSELDRVSQALTTRIRQLAERYETPLHELERRVEHYRERVAEHLKRMGINFRL